MILPRSLCFAASLADCRRLNPALRPPHGPAPCRGGDDPPGSPAFPEQRSGFAMIDFYSWPTPIGHKIHIMLEETGLA